MSGLKLVPTGRELNLLHASVKVNDFSWILLTQMQVASSDVYEDHGNGPLLQWICVKNDIGSSHKDSPHVLLGGIFPNGWLVL